MASLTSSEKRRRWFGALAALAGFVLVGVALLPKLVSRQPAPQEGQAQVPASRAAAPAERGIDTPVSNAATTATAPVFQAAAMGSEYFDCMISASETVEIGSSILGTIETIAVERSDYVEAGQVLASLESRVEEAAVRVAQARAERRVELESTQVSLQLGKKRLERAVDLFHGATLSLDLHDEVQTETTLAELGVEEARENHRLAVLQLEQARATLERRTIRSPIAGFVVERLMSPGEVVDDQTILTISQIDPLRVDVILPTQLFGSIATGDRMEILPEAPLDKARVSTVTIVDRVLDGASGTFGVRLLLPNPDRDLPGGLRCQARLMKGDQDVSG